MRPRSYLSHSQKKCWKTNPEEYVKKYLFDKQQFITKEMKFGSKMAIALEEDELTGDILLDQVMMEIPKFEMRDQPSNVDLKVGKDVIPLFGKMDTRKADHSAFKEYKTGKDGKGGWTQKKVDEDSQITFYATMCFLLTKEVPGDIELVWIITEDEVEIGEGGEPYKTGRIVPTGELRRFTTHRTMAHVINEMADMRKVWREIGERCEKELL